jgi:hypothetical protein
MLGVNSNEIIYLRHNGGNHRISFGKDKVMKIIEIKPGNWLAIWKAALAKKAQVKVKQPIPEVFKILICIKYIPGNVNAAELLAFIHTFVLGKYYLLWFLQPWNRLRDPMSCSEF